MSCEQLAFIRRDKVPSRKAWQAAVESIGFDFEIDPELIPFEHEGFLPCKLQGKDAGVEISYILIGANGYDVNHKPANPIRRLFRSLVGRGWENRIDDSTTANAIINRRLAQGRDSYISFRWSSSAIECASAMILSYALAHDFDAIISYEGEDPDPLDQLLKETHQCIEDIGKDVNDS